MLKMGSTSSRASVSFLVLASARRASFLHHLVTSRVLDEAGRARPPVSAITAALKKKVRGNAHALSRGSIQSTSLDTEKLFGLSSSSFETLSVESWRLQGCYTESFLNAEDN